MHVLNKRQKVELFMCFFIFNLAPFHAYWGVEVELHAFLTSALDGDAWSASRHGCFIPRERTPSIHWI